LNSDLNIYFSKKPRISTNVQENIIVIFTNFAFNPLQLLVIIRALSWLTIIEKVIIISREA